MSDNRKASEDYLDFMIKRALDDISEECGSDYEKELEKLEEPNYTDEYKRNINKLFSKKKYYKSTKSTGWLKVAVILCICTVSSSAFVYNANANFRYFINKIFSSKDTHVDIGNTVTSLSYDFSDIPNSWEHFYIPEYIPIGYRVENIEASELNIIIKYIYNDETIRFTQANDIERTISLDNERSDVTNIKIGDYDGYFVAFDEDNKIVWDNGTYTFSITSTLEKKELILIAESLKPVTN